MYDPLTHQRRSIRLRGYDYTQPGAYFITVCTQGRAHLFGEVIGGVTPLDAPYVALNDYGKLVVDCWNDLSHHYPVVLLDAFVVMPNHVHGIITLLDHKPDIVVGAGLRPAPTQPDYRQQLAGLPEIVRAFKSFSARRVNEMRRTMGMTIWQRNYYEHIVRNEGELKAIRDYIINNPAGWEKDPDNIPIP